MFIFLFAHSTLAKKQNQFTKFSAMSKPSFSKLTRIDDDFESDEADVGGNVHIIRGATHTRHCGKGEVAGRRDCPKRGSIIIGDGHQPNNRGLYTHFKDSLLKVGWSPPT